MDFFALLWLLALTVGVPMAAMLYKYRRDQLELERERLKAEARGLTVGELKASIREAVEEATRPLLERIEALERERIRAEVPFDPYRAESGSEWAPPTSARERR